MLHGRLGAAEGQPGIGVKAVLGVEGTAAGGGGLPHSSECISQKGRSKQQLIPVAATSCLSLRFLSGTSPVAPTPIPVLWMTS